MASLEEINRELADIVDRLNKLPRDAFAERWKLRGRQEELRDAAQVYAIDHDHTRLSDDLETELAARRSQLEAILERSPNMGGQAAGGHLGGATVGSEAAINSRISDAQGAPEIRTRIARLEALLAERDPQRLLDHTDDG